MFHTNFFYYLQMNAPKIKSLPKQNINTAKSIVNNSMDVAEEKVVEEVLSTSTIETLVLVRKYKNKIIIETTL